MPKMQVYERLEGGEDKNMDILHYATHDGAFITLGLVIGIIYYLAKLVLL
jgi:hypothetical protein